MRVISNSPATFSNYTAELMVGVYPNKPVATNNTPVCATDTLKLYSSTTTTGNIAYLWTGPNNYITSSQNPVILNATTAMSGSYVVTASIYGCGTKDTTVVTVNPSPIIPVATSNSPICETDTLKLYSTNSTSGVTWSWTGPNSFTSSTQNPNIINSTLAANGDYIVTASLSNGCNKKDTVTALVKPLPANMSISNNGPLCVGATLNLSSSTTSSGVTWSWTGPNSFTSTNPNPAIGSSTTAATGDYIATATLNGCVIKDTTTATINPVPNVPTISANTPVCVGQDLKLTASTIAGANYNWSGPGSYSSTSQNPIRTATTFSYAGNYSVTATLNNCISSPATINVGVINAPNITMYPSPKDSICQGATVNFISSATTPGSSPVYRWYKNNTPIFGASATNYSTSTATDLDEYFCTLNVTGVCAEPYTDSSNKITMHVLPWLVPSVTISQTPTGTLPSGTLITFNANPANGGKIPKYQWKRNSANVVGALSNTWGAPNLSNKDIICVEMTSTYMCPNPSKVMSNCMEVSIQTVSIEGINWQNNPPRIYPNPTKDKLIIEGITKGTEIKLTDVLGRMVVHMTAKQAIEIISTISLVPGTYMLQLHNEAANYMVVKIVKE
jgi:hypothetical protein